MKNRFLLCCVLGLLAATSSIAQTLVTLVKPAGSPLWGYANLKGEVIIAPQFNINMMAYRFSSNGFAAIYDKENNKYYFIDLKGQKLKTRVSNFNLLGYDGAGTEGFYDRRAAITYNGKWGYLNDSGRVVIKPKYEKATIFSNGHAVVRGESGYFVIDRYGHEIPAKIFKASVVKHFSEGLAIFESSGRFGCIDTTGTAVISAQFDGLGYFVGGLAWAKSGGMVGYIDAQGTWVIKPQFEAGMDFDPESGLARVKTKRGWAYVNRSGEFLNMKDTQLWGDFSEGLAMGKKDGLVGFFDNHGEWIIKPQFDGARDFKNGYAAVKHDGLWGLIDKKGGWTIVPTFTGMKDMEVVW